MSVEGWKSLFDVLAVVLLGLTFVAGFGGLVTGKVVNRRQENRLRQLQGALTQAKIVAANATAKAGEATRAADAEKIERLKLEAQIAPRRMTKKQKVRIAENCAGFKDVFSGKRVKVVSYSLDLEGFVLAEQIVSSLRVAGMVVDDDSMSITPRSTYVFGINVFGSDAELAKDIANAIGSSGGPIAVSFVENDPTAGAKEIEYGAPAPQATILVGLKPPDKGTIEELTETTHK